MKEKKNSHLVKRRAAALRSLDSVISLIIQNIKEFQATNIAYNQIIANIIRSLLRVILQYDIIYSVLLKKKADSSVDFANTADVKMHRNGQASKPNKIAVINSCHELHSGKPYIQNMNIEEDKDQLYDSNCNKELIRVYKKHVAAQFPKVSLHADSRNHVTSVFSK